LTFGDGEETKLIIISAGNIRDESDWENYPNSNHTASVENPAQSWNALTIGAYTKKIKVNDPRYSAYTPLAKEGELSPYSTTSLMWEKKWPVKPDVVFEGGNLLKAPDDTITSHEDLDLLSTSKTFNLKPFETINATSAATAQASWFAAKIAYEYPNARPETIRGLIVHSANWDNAMINQMNIKQSNRGDYKKLLKVFGYGIPDLDKAIYSHESAFTFIAEEIIQPFELINSNGTTKDIQIYDLPWPSELLSSMGDNDVILRITLSYFIQPGAGEIGWKDKYRYQSHGLRFDINNSTEDLTVFKQRINKAVRDDDYEHNSNNSSGKWKIGIDNRNSGSIHSDIWEGTAAELATSHYIAVFPVIGWWRERKQLGKVDHKAHYSLIVSLETQAQEVPLYTTVRNMIEIPVEIPIIP
ncbi:MAG: S8 family serine peptidase, partial [Tannerella sp.]|nr:S8 family serine peptidase [Tannerella sp.]